MASSFFKVGAGQPVATQLSGWIFNIFLFHLGGPCQKCRPLFYLLTWTTGSARDPCKQPNRVDDVDGIQMAAIMRPSQGNGTWIESKCWWPFTFSFSPLKKKEKEENNKQRKKVDRRRLENKWTSDRIEKDNRFQPHLLCIIGNQTQVVGERKGHGKRNVSLSFSRLTNLPEPRGRFQSPLWLLYLCGLCFPSIPPPLLTTSGPEANNNRQKPSLPSVFQLS